MIDIYRLLKSTSLIHAGPVEFNNIYQVCRNTRRTPELAMVSSPVAAEIAVELCIKSFTLTGHA